jgi:hypothetical protein
VRIRVKKKNNNNKNNKKEKVSCGTIYHLFYCTAEVGGPPMSSAN